MSECVCEYECMYIIIQLRIQGDKFVLRKSLLFVFTATNIDVK